MKWLAATLGALSVKLIWEAVKLTAVIVFSVFILRMMGVL